MPEIETIVAVGDLVVGFVMLLESLYPDTDVFPSLKGAIPTGSA